MTSLHQPSDGLSLQSYVQILRRRRRLIGVTALLVALFAVVPTLLQEPVYASSAQVRISSLDQEGVFQTDSGNRLPSDRTVELLTEMEIIRSRPIRELVEARFAAGAPDFSGPEVELVGFSEIVEIEVQAQDAAAAAAVADAYVDVYVEDRRSRSVEALAVKAEELREQSAEANAELDQIGQRLGTPGLPPGEISSLQLKQATLTAQVLDFDRRADELAVEAALRGRGTQVHESATVPSSPERSGFAQSAAIGLVLGLLLGVAVAVVVEVVQDRVSSREDLAAIRPDVPVLAAIPHTDDDDITTRTSSHFNEAFRYLRTGVRLFGLNSELRSVLVTSAIGSEGKTTTAVNLAHAMADAGDRVLLVDVDLRRPSVHKHFGLSNDVGLMSVVLGDAVVKDVVHFVRENLAVVPAGPPVQNPTEVLGSTQLGRVLESLVGQSDFTIVDSSPVLPISDALIAGQHVDGAIVVSRLGLVRRRATRELLARLQSAGIPVIGMVANDTTEEGIYGYYDTEPTDAVGAVDPAPGWNAAPPGTVPSRPDTATQ